MRDLVWNGWLLIDSTHGSNMSFAICTPHGWRLWRDIFPINTLAWNDTLCKIYYKYT